MSNLKSVVLILSDARGVYIPRDFVCDDWNEIAIEHCDAWGISLKDATILQNPETEGYWDTWNDVLNYAEYIDLEGNQFKLHQDGDLWALCYDKMTNEEKRNFSSDVDTENSDF